MKYFCKTKCFHGGKIWTPGETLESIDGQEVPDHFALEAPKVEKPETKVPNTMSEMNRKGEVETGNDKVQSLSQYGKRQK